MISDNSTLTPFQPSELFGFSVKLLDLPSKAAHFLYRLRVVLRHILSYNIVRALHRRWKALPGRVSLYDRQEIL